MSRACSVSARRAYGKARVCCYWGVARSTHYARRAALTNPNPSTTGCSVEQARFVPTSAEKLPDPMGAWERYAYSDAPDRLFHQSILYAQFEALHSFLHGNGRLARILVRLFMWQVGLMRRGQGRSSGAYEIRCLPKA